MHVPDETFAASAGPDMAQIERTLRVSIKLMRRGQRAMQRLRRKESEQLQSAQATNDSE